MTNYVERSINRRASDPVADLMVKCTTMGWPSVGVSHYRDNNIIGESMRLGLFEGVGYSVISMERALTMAAVALSNRIKEFASIADVCIGRLIPPEIILIDPLPEGPLYRGNRSALERLCALLEWKAPCFHSKIENGGGRTITVACAGDVVLTIEGDDTNVKWIEDRAAARLVHFLCQNDNDWRKVPTARMVDDEAEHDRDVLLTICNVKNLNRPEFVVERKDEWFGRQEDPVFEAKCTTGQITKIGYGHSANAASEMAARFVISQIQSAPNAGEEAMRLIRAGTRVANEAWDRASVEENARILGSNRRKLGEIVRALGLRPPVVVSYREPNGMVKCKIVAGFYSTEAQGVDDEEAVEIASQQFLRDTSTKRIQYRRLPTRADLPTEEWQAALIRLCRAKNWPLPTYSDARPFARLCHTEEDNAGDDHCFDLRVSIGTIVGTKGSGYSPAWARENGAFSMIRKLVENDRPSTADLNMRFNTVERPTC